MLTGVKDLDFKILNQLEDIDLVNVCKTNTVANKLCNDQGFWLQRIMIKYPYLDLNILKQFILVCQNCQIKNLNGYKKMVYQRMKREF